MKSFVSLTAAAGLVMVLSACSSTPTDTAATTPAPAASAPAASKPATDTPNANASSTVRATALPAHLDPTSPIAKDRSVFFAFDQSIVGAEYNALIEKHGKYLAATPTLKVKIEGNADERGSAEYNLALGQRRAEATLKALKVWGVNESQMEAISWGEERPQEKGHDESAYSRNRRADIVYPQQ